MATELRSLRVAAEMDTGNYTAGMNAKVAADKAGAASSREVGQAVEQQNTKISQSGDVLSRLSRQYVDGYASAQKMQSAVNNLSRGIDTGKVTMAQAEPILEGIYRKHGLLADSAQFAAKGQHEFAQAIAAVNARMAAQVTITDQAATSQKRYHAANENAPGAGAFQTANVAAQFQDVGVTAAMGMSPLMIGLQQGTQLSAVLGPMGAAGAVKSLGAAFLSILSPVSLATIGLTAAAAAAIQYFMTGSDDAKKLDAALEAHQQNIRDIKASWGEAANGVTEYTAKSRVVLQAENIITGTNLKKQLDRMTEELESGGALLRTNTERIKADIERVSEEIGRTPDLTKLGELSTKLTALDNELQTASSSGPLTATKNFADFRTEIEAFGVSLRKAEPDYISLQNAVSKRINAEPTNKALGEMGEKLLDIISPSANLQRNIEANSVAFHRLAEAAATARRQFETFKEAQDKLKSIAPAFVSESDQALKALKEGTAGNSSSENTRLMLREYEATLKRISDLDQRGIDQARRVQEAELQALRARTPDQKATAARARESATVVEGESAAARENRISLAGTRARVEAEHQLHEAQQERVRSMNEDMEAHQFELTLIGKTASEVAALRMEYDLTSQLRQEAARNGTTADEQEIALIRQKAAEYGRLTEQLAKINLQRSLQFERDQMLRSTEDQAVASRLQSFGLKIDLGSAEANQIRALEQYKGAREELTGFFTDLRSGMLDDGKSIGESFADALKNAMTNRLNKLSDSLIDSFVTSILGNGTGSGGAIGKFLGMNGGPANDNFQTNTTLGSFLGLGGGGFGASNDNVTGGAVDKAMSLLGAHEQRQNSSINSFLKQGGVNIDAAQTAWCAAFVNSSLNQVGVDGTGRLNANSFLNWGRGVNASQVMKGDVLVQARGLGANQQGGHVGLATGLSRLSGGREQLEMLSGNSSHSVAKTWVDANELQIRRSTEASGALERLGGSTSTAAGNLSNLQGAAGQAIQGLGNFGSGLGQLSQQLMSAAQGGTGGGGFFSNLLGSIGKMVGGISPTSALWRPNTTLGGFLANGYDEGGFTGYGGKYDPAGIVHRGEVVWSQDDIRRFGGVAAVEALRTGRGLAMGYADGGIVGRRSIPVPNLAANQNAAGGSNSATRVTVGVSVDKNGNLDAYVKSIAQAEASSAAERHVQDFSDNALPYRLQEHQMNPRRVG